jgi:hypothetical protein
MDARENMKDEQLSLTLGTKGPMTDQALWIKKKKEPHFSISW